MQLIYCYFFFVIKEIAFHGITNVEENNMLATCKSLCVFIAFWESLCHNDKEDFSASARFGHTFH